MDSHTHPLQIQDNTNHVNASIGDSGNASARLFEDAHQAPPPPHKHHFYGINLGIFKLGVTSEGSLDIGANVGIVRTEINLGLENSVKVGAGLGPIVGGDVGVGAGVNRDGLHSGVTAGANVFKVAGANGYFNAGVGRFTGVNADVSSYIGPVKAEAGAGADISQNGLNAGAGGNLDVGKAAGVHAEGRFGLDQDSQASADAGAHVGDLQVGAGGGVYTDGNTEIRPNVYVKGGAAGQEARFDMNPEVSDEDAYSQPYGTITTTQGDRQAIPQAAAAADQTTDAQVSSPTAAPSTDAQAAPQVTDAKTTTAPTLAATETAQVTEAAPATDAKASAPADAATVTDTKASAQPSAQATDAAATDAAAVAQSASVQATEAPAVTQAAKADSAPAASPEVQAPAAASAPVEVQAQVAAPKFEDATPANIDRVENVLREQIIDQSTVVAQAGQHSYLDILKAARPGEDPDRLEAEATFIARINGHKYIYPGLPVAMLSQYEIDHQVKAGVAHHFGWDSGK